MIQYPNRPQLFGSLIFCVSLLVMSGDIFAQEAPAQPQEAAQPAAATVDPNETDPAKIMQAVELREEADRTKSRVILKITDGAGRARERVVRSWGMHFDGGQRQLMLFESPSDVRGTGLLSIDYDEGNKDDDQWLYLPSLKKSTRISSGDKSGSFMGTDLTYSDMTQSDPSHYTYTVLKPSVKVAGEDCWLIQSKPITKKAKEETGYLKQNIWVSKSRLIPLQLKAWVIEGKKLKYIKFEDIKKLDGRWTAHKISARTMRGRTEQSRTVIQFTEMTSGNADVTDDLFTQRRLEQGL